MREGSKQIRPQPTLSAEPSVGPDPMTPRSRPELKSGSRHLTDGATGARADVSRVIVVSARWSELSVPQL